MAMLAAAPAWGAPFGPPQKGEPAPPGIARPSEQPYRTDTFEIPLAVSEEEGDEVEYQVRMKAGETVVYAWSVEAPADEFYSDFHGNSDAKSPLRVVSYKEGFVAGAQGALIAPFDGLHGWLFKNESPKPVTVKLTLAGFYELRSIRETMGLDAE